MGGGIVLCLISGLVLLFRKDGLRLANLLLGALLLSYGLTLTNSLLNLTGLASKYNFLYFLPISYSLSIGPFLYFYLKARTTPSFSFRKQDLVHFILPLWEFGLYMYVGFQSVEYKSMFWREVMAPYYQHLEGVMYFLSRFLYILLSFRILFAYKKKANYTWDEFEAKWLIRFLYVLAFLITITLIYDVADLILLNTYDFNIYNHGWLIFPIILCYAIASFWIALHAYTHSHQELIIPTPAPKPSQASTQPAASRKELYRLIEEEKVYLNPELDLGLLAKMMGMHKNQLSALINEEGQNFNSLINHYRIEAFKARINNPQYAHMSLLGLAFEVGFNSKATFHRVFKQETGQTPSQYSKSLVSNHI